MKPYEEQECLEAFRNIKRLIGRMKEDQLLEVLARDDQPNNSRDPDPIHQIVRNICGDKQKGTGLIGASHAIQNTFNLLRHLETTVPVFGVRKSSLTDCLACGNPVLDKVAKGFCRECLKEYKATGAWQSHGDFVTFKQAQIASLAGQND